MRRFLFMETFSPQGGCLDIHVDRHRNFIFLSKKTFKMFSFRTIGPMILKVGMNYVQSLSMAQIMT